MQYGIVGTMAALLMCGASSAQTADQPLQFEVASVKPAPPRAPGTGQGTRGCFGGPGSRDPGHFTCSNASVSLMALYAYDLKPYVIRPPVAEDTALFNVAAKVPPGATAEQIKAMMRDLLAERFKLAFHREKTEKQGYALIVAKGGLKMKSSAPPPAIADGAPSPPPARVTDADGFAYFPPRNGMSVAWSNGLTRWVGNNVPAEYLAGLSNSLTGQPAIDATGLKGKYDFTLTFRSDTAAGASPTDTADGGLTVFEAFEKQLGLKLEPRKIVIEEFVIDHAERAPIEN